VKNSYRENSLTAGRIAGEVRALGKALIQPGASYNDIIAQILALIAAKGAFPAFPPQMALNEVAAHYLPLPDQDIIFSDQLVKLDVGVCVQGAIGDCAVTVDLSGKKQHLIDAAEEALKRAQESVRVGLPLSELGAIIEEAITARGLQPVRNLCGHGLGFYKVHTPPLVPNCKDRSKGVIQPGMTFAIEPFATDGKGWIREEGTATIFSVTKQKAAPSTESSHLLKALSAWKGLPFSLHDALRLAPESALHDLLDAGIVSDYPPLVEIERGWVAQAENTLLVDPQGRVTVTTLVLA
jgi:methionyl aminopeptidase